MPSPIRYWNSPDFALECHCLDQFVSVAPGNNIICRSIPGFERETCEDLKLSS